MMLFSHVENNESPKIAEIKQFLQDNQLGFDQSIGIFVTLHHQQRLIACGGIAGNVIKCVAIDERYRGEGICLSLATELIYLAYQQQQNELFIYTKIENESLFQQCGFHRIADVPQVMVLMENSRYRLAHYIEQLTKSYLPAKKIGAIVMNADPFTYGHRYLIEQALSRGLTDGMTISFHHAFRGGDLLINHVVGVLAEMGFKDLTLASSSLTTCHAPLIDFIQQGVISQIYTSGLRGPLAEQISRGLLAKPVQIHSHGGRVQLIQSGELAIDVAFLGVPSCDVMGNANGYQGNAGCGSLGYAQVNAQYARQVVLLTENIVAYPAANASIGQDQVDWVVQLDKVGDADKIGADATRMTSNPRELLIARRAAEVIIHSGYFKAGFSLQTGTGGASLAVTRFLAQQMQQQAIYAEFALGGITATMVELHEKGLIKRLLDVQSFDKTAAESLARNADHCEISANQYANFTAKGASVEQLDVVVLSALEIDCQFNVNVLTGSDGVLRGASGGHSDTAIAASLSIIVAPLVRGRIPTVVAQVNTCITPGHSIDILVTDQGIAVNPVRTDLISQLTQAGFSLLTIEELHQRALLLTGQPAAIRYREPIVAVVRYRDGSIIDVVHQIDQ